MSRNDIGADANPERARGVPHMIAGGARRGVGGWAGFGAVALLWPPLWFLAVLDLPLDGAALIVGLAVAMSALYCVTRWWGLPRYSWAALAYLAIATVLLALAMCLGDVPDHPWAWHYPIFMCGLLVIVLPAALVAAYLMMRLAQSQADTDAAR